VTTHAPFAGPVRVGQIALPAKDLDRAGAFYRDTLGLRFQFRAPPGLAFFDCGGVRLMLSLPEGPSESPMGGIIDYVVPDLDAAYSALTARGVAFLDAPHLIARMPDHEL
jgi:methylmalonyl-CoA/ethylmalonyl-CoA epimerase